jgi:hypothetical protein
VTTTLPAVVGTAGYRCFDAPGDRLCEIRITDGANVVTNPVRFTSSTK